MLAFQAFLAADVPRWIWAALVMAAFVAVTLVTMLLTRYPIRRAPPTTPEDNERAREQRR